MFMSSTWDVKELTHYSKRVGHGVPGVVAVLCESIAGPHQLIAAKTQSAQIKKQQQQSHTAISSCDSYAYLVINSVPRVP